MLTEQQRLLNTNPFSINYGTNKETNDTTHLHVKVDYSSVQPIAKKLSFGFYTLLKIVYAITIILVIIGFLFVIIFNKFQQEFMTATLIAVTISCFFSCYGLIKFGTTQNQISQMKTMSKIYKEETETLKDTKNVLKNEISDLEFETEGLTQQLNELKNAETKYSFLITQLENITESKEEIMDKVDDANQAFDRMHNLIEMNHKAYLLGKFYHVLPKGLPEYVVKNTLMDQPKYERFSFMITKQWRAKFTKMGSNLKEIWSCEKITVKQFLKTVDEIVENHARDLKKLEFQKTFSEVSDDDHGSDSPIVQGKLIQDKSDVLERNFSELPVGEARQVPFVDIISTNEHEHTIKEQMKKSRLKLKKKIKNKLKIVNLCPDDTCVDRSHSLKSDINDEKQMHEIYFEKQFLEGSMLHALNALFQEKRYSKQDLDKICHQLAPDKMINPHKSFLGNYDVNVLMMILENAFIDVKWLNTRNAENELNLSNEDWLCSKDMYSEFVGFILNITLKTNRLQKQLGIKRRHWMTIKRIDGIWCKLDSKHTKAIRYVNDNEVNELQAWLIDTCKNNDGQLLICRTKRSNKKLQSLLI